MILHRQKAPWAAVAALCLVTASASAAPEDDEKTAALTAEKDVLSAEQNQFATTTTLDSKVRGDSVVALPGTPGQPVLLGPEDALELGDGKITFHWRDGGGPVRAQYFRVCVFERGTNCHTTGTEYPLPSEDPISGTYYEPDGGLPLAFQGKSLSWRVTACTLDTATPSLAAATELCASSSPRVLDWTRPTARLLGTSPIPSGGPPSHLPELRWEHGSPASTDYQLICLAEPGHTCGSRYSKLIRIDDPAATSAEIDHETWVHHEGTHVSWRVALCDAWDDCRWSEPESATFPYRQNSFGTLLPVIRTAACENCHSFSTGNTVFDRHIAEGRFSESASVSDPATCATCHNPSRGFPTGWRSPSRFLPLECKNIRRHLLDARRDEPQRYGVTSPDPALTHLRDDDFVEWAVSRSGIVSQVEWDAQVELWVRFDMQCERENRASVIDRSKLPVQRYPWLYVHE